MNHEQWTQLLAATHGHTPGPWETGEDADAFCFDRVRFGDHLVAYTDSRCGCPATLNFIEDQNARLTLAAPDLRKEVERLRGHYARLREMVDPDSDLACVIDAAIDGEEVPE